VPGYIQPDTAGFDMPEDSLFTKIANYPDMIFCEAEL
jgi:hypothetical protein